MFRFALVARTAAQSCEEGSGPPGTRPLAGAGFAWLRPTGVGPVNDGAQVSEQVRPDCGPTVSVNTQATPAPAPPSVSAKENNTIH